MSFNPTRLQQGGAPRKLRNQDPHAGLKHSQIVRSLGPQAVRFEDMRLRQDAPFGWRIPVFQGKSFETEFLYVCSRNSLGTMRHPTGERCVRVLAGQLYVIIGEDTLTVNAHQSVTLEAGVTYKLATSGTLDAELFVCQSVGYEKDLEMLAPPEAVNVDSMVAAVHAATTPAPAHTERRPESMAKQQAAEIAAKRATRTPVQRQPRAPLAGQQVQGVNPRPVGAGGYSEE